MVKKVTAPKTYDPGRGRPKEHLAYLNEREMAYLRSINGNNMERGPKGLPSFPPEDAVGSSSRSTSSGSRTSSSSSGAGRDSSRGLGQGAGGSAVGRGPGGSSGLGGGGKGAGSSGTQSRGPGGPSGPNSGPSQSSGSKAAPSAPSRTPSSPMGGQGPSFSSSKAASSYNKDRTVQQKVQINDARNAVKNTPAARNDLALGGIRTLNVGPIGTPVKVGAVQRPPKSLGPLGSGWDERLPGAPSVPSIQKSKVAIAGGVGVMGIGTPTSQSMNLISPLTVEGLANREDLQERLSGYGAPPPRKNVDGSVPIPRMNPLNDPTKFKLGSPDVLQGVNPTALSKLARLQEAINRPLTISSGYRNPLLNKRVGGAKMSQHMSGNAIDIKIPGASAAETADIIRKASEIGFGGIGGYRPGSIHVDVASQRAWGPNYSGISIGGPMGNALSAHAAGRIAEVGPDYAAMERNPSVRGVASAPSIPTKTVSASMDPTAAVTSAFSTAKDLYNSLPSMKDLSERYAGLQKDLDAYRQAKTGPLSAVTGPIADARLKEAVTGYASQGIQALKDFISPSSAMAATPSGPIMSGEKAAAKTIAQAEGEKILDVENVPESDEVYGPKNVSPEVQELMADIDRKNKYGVRGIKSFPVVGNVVRAGDALRGVFTGKNTTEADADLKRAYMQGNATQRAELERGYPNLTKFAQQAGLEPQLPMSNYENWRQRSFGTGGGGTSTTVAGAGGTPDIGSGGKAEYRPIPRQVADAGQADAAEKKESGRPQAYYNWDAGVGIPSPGDPDYTLYLKYLEEKAAARAAVS